MPPECGVTAASTMTESVYDNKHEHAISAIAALVEKLEHEKNDVDHQVEFLGHIRKLLEERVQQEEGKSEQLQVDYYSCVGPAISEAMGLHPTSATLQYEAARVLQFLSFLDPSFSEGMTLLLFSAMDQHRDHAGIQEESCCTMYNLVEATIHFEGHQTIASGIDSILWVMDHHSANVKILSSGLAIVCNLASIPEIQPQMAKAISSILKAFETKDAHVQEYACTALSKLSLNNPTNQQCIGLFGVPLILAATEEFPQESSVHEHALNALANLASNPKSKDLLVQEGGLQSILSSMNQHLQVAAVQANACQALSHLAFGSSREKIKTKMAPSIRCILHAMRLHGHHSEVQLYGCCALRNLSKLHHTAIVSMGGMTTILVSMREFQKAAMLQEHACGALHNLLSKGTVDDIFSVASEGGIATILGVMKEHSLLLEVQKQGLGALACLSTRAANNHESILCGGGLQVLLNSIDSFNENGEVAQFGCKTLKNLSRQSLDFQMAVASKGGIAIVLTVMRRHIHSVVVQDFGCACMRNLCLNVDNRRQVVTEGGISTLLATMTIYPKHAAIQAYGCDALGRLASAGSENRIAIESEHGIIAILQAMKEHPNHPGVQDRACFVLYNMIEHKQAVLSMRDQDILALLPAPKNRPAASKLSTDRLTELVKVLKAVSDG